jgi:translation initiation factor IF-1
VKEPNIEIDGRVIELMRNALLVEINGSHRVRCMLSGQTRKFGIQVVVGDASI